MKAVRCVLLSATWFEIEWDAPMDNNSPITKYHVYLAERRMKINEVYFGEGEKKGTVQAQPSGTPLVDKLTKITTIEDP